MKTKLKEKEYELIAKGKHGECFYLVLKEEKRTIKLYRISTYFKLSNEDGSIESLSELPKEGQKFKVKKLGAGGRFTSYELITIPIPSSKT